MGLIKLCLNRSQVLICFTQVTSLKCGGMNAICASVLQLKIASKSIGPSLVCLSLLLLFTTGFAAVFIMFCEFPLKAELVISGQAFSSYLLPASMLCELQRIDCPIPGLLLATFC